MEWINWLHPIGDRLVNLPASHSICFVLLHEVRRLWYYPHTRSPRAAPEGASQNKGIAIGATATGSKKFAHPHEKYVGASHSRSWAGSLAAGQHTHSIWTDAAIEVGSRGGATVLSESSELARSYGWLQLRADHDGTRNWQNWPVGKIQHKVNISERYIWI
jgi:hypothetical protein